MRRTGGPATGRVGSFNGITNILAITFTHLSNDTMLGIIDILAIAGIWPHLFTLDEHFRRAVDGREGWSKTVRRICHFSGSGSRRTELLSIDTSIDRWRRAIGQGSRHSRRSRHRLFPGRPQILVESFFAALTTKTTFTVSAKAARGIKHIRAIDPDAASL